MLDFIKHKSVLMSVLKDICSDQTIAPFLGFKGGTAAMLFYGLDRDSVDLDFDLLDIEKCEFIHHKVREIVLKYGELLESSVGQTTFVNTISYEKGRPALKVEINKRDYGSSYEIKNILGISVKVMVKGDMMAHKMCAMYERLEKTSRDIYDVKYFCSKHWNPNKKIIESRNNMSYVEFLKECLKKVENLDNKNILNGLGELLNGSQKDNVKEKLKKDVIFNLKLLIAGEEDVRFKS